MSFFQLKGMWEINDDINAHRNLSFMMKGIILVRKENYLPTLENRDFKSNFHLL